jgi:hypothetical protein
MEDVGTFYSHLDYFTAIWYSLRLFWYTYLIKIMYIFPVLVCCTKKNLAALVSEKIRVPCHGLDKLRTM